MDPGNPNNVPLPGDDDDDRVPAQVIQQGFKEVQMELRAQNLARQIREFNGDGSRRFNEWLRDVERVGTALEATPERFKALAFMTLKGTAVDFLSCIVRENPNIPWPALRHQLMTQFSDRPDEHLAKQKLMRLSQHKGETIQSFCERILALAEDAYPAQNFGHPLVQAALSDTLTDGVIDDSMARKLIRNRPPTFAMAQAIANEEQQANRAFSIRRRDEPMEVDELKSSNLEIKSIKDQLAGLSEKVSEVLAIGQPVGQGSGVNRQSAGTGPQKTGGATQHQWTTDGKPICSFCKKVGHTQTKCYAKRRQQGQTTQSNRGNDSSSVSTGPRN